MEAGGKRHISHPSRKDEFTIYGLGDLHLGSKATAEGQLEKDVEAIRADHNAFWFGLGDYAEYISHRDRRANLQDMAEWLTLDDLSHLGHTLNQKVRDVLKPIKHKCLGLLFGNHEDVYQRTLEQTDMHCWLCQELGVPNLRYSAFVDVIFTRVPRVKRARLGKYPGVGYSSASFRFYLHHGAGGSNTPGGKLNRLVQFMDAFESDIYMIGHVHDKKGQRLVSITANPACDTITHRDRVGIVSGSYLRTYAQGVTTYGEKKGYRPAPLGASFVRIHPESRTITAEL